LESIKAIGFDLFNTLITADKGAVDEAVRRLITGLRQNNFSFDEDLFQITYKETALGFIKKAQSDGIETHNRFWISATLQKLGYPIDPDDDKIAKSLDKYFSAFFDYCHLIPGTVSMLKQLKPDYRLGLLSNFTHAPACRELLNYFELTKYFNLILVSGELGYRKPHPEVFNRLVKRLAVERDHMIYVGDNLEADVVGALNAGIKPVWFTYAKNHRVAMVPGDMPEEVKIPEPDVAKVKSWKDFLQIL
jgi:putative hydrolase of the HAD superfamily